MKKVISLLLLVFLLGSCSLFQSSYDYLSDKIEIKIKGTQDEEDKIVDSLVVKFEPVYWEEDIEIDSTIQSPSNNTKTEFNLSGYSVWILETDKIRYNEVKKLDTVVYFIRKK